MKRCSLFLTLIVSMVAGSFLQGCSSDPDVPTTTLDVKVAVGEVGTNSAELIATSSGAGDYAYMVANASTATSAPAAAVLFAQGVNGKLSEGKNSLKIVDLEAETEYVVYFATRTTDGFSEVQVIDGIKTTKYTQFVTLIEVNDYDKIKYHVEVPKGATIGVGILLSDTYVEMKETWQKSDADFVYNENGRTLITATGTYTFDGWYDLDYETGEMVKTPIVPGYGLTLVAAEMEFGTNIYGEEGWRPKFDFDKYNEYVGGGGGGVMSVPNNTRVTADEEESCWKTDYHTTIHCMSKAPQILNAHVKVDVTRHTTQTIEFMLTPDDDIQNYMVSAIQMADWETSVERNGSETAAVTYWATQSGMTSGEQQLKVEKLDPTVEYRLVLIGHGNAEGTLRSVDYYDFKAKEATKDAPKIVVKGIKNPEGEDSPWSVWFNVKCTTKDAESGKYLCNDTNEWNDMLSSGVTNNIMMSSFGVDLSANEVELMNSDSGLNLNFNSWEETSSRLAVVGYNDEETGNDLDTDDNGWADNKTIEIQPLSPVSSSLFTDLLGDWTASARLYTAVYNQETGDVEGWELSDTPSKTKVSIVTAPDYPSSCTQEAYDIYADMGFDKAAVDELYSQFVESAAKHARKIKGQNELLCLGLDFADFGATTYMSPWDLFVHPYYNSYTTDDIFHDYGPKWHLQIAAGDKVSVPINSARVAPLMASIDYGADFILAGTTDASYAPDIEAFETVISVDKNTLTVKPAVINGVTYYPSILSADSYGNVSVMAKMNEIVLTKGWTGDDQGMLSKMTKRGANNKFAVTSTNPSKKFVKTTHKTRIVKSKFKGVDFSKSMTIEPVSYDKQRAALVKKEAARKANRK